MGSATDHASASTTTALDAAAGIDLDVAAELFAAARLIGGSSQLSGALADSAAPAELRTAVVQSVFGPSMKSETVAVLRGLVSERWSNAADLVDGVEELGVRAASIAAGDDDVEGELFAFSQTVARNPDLELALGSRLGDSEAKGALVDALIGGRTSPATTLIVSSLARHSRERRVRQMLARAMRLVADQRGRTMATVTTAVPLRTEQAERLRAALSARYGTGIALNTVIDPTVVGGMRVQISDDVIDASVSSRLAELRQRLAG